MPDIRLAPISYVVLGLIEVMQPATPYDLKTAARRGASNLWSLPHTQLYAECGRLAGAGLLHEERESGGRRRRIYRLTDEGARELAAWRADIEPTDWELRDAGLLKLFFGADPKALGEAQILTHERRLAEYEELREIIAELPRGMRLALEAGIGHEREYLRFWREIAAGRDPS